MKHIRLWFGTAALTHAASRAQAASRDQRGRLMNTTERMERGLDTLEASRRTLNETEEVGAGRRARLALARAAARVDLRERAAASSITEELARNRDTILASKAKVRAPCPAPPRAPGPLQRERAHAVAATWPQVRTIRSTTGQATMLLRRMSRRETKFKIMIGILILTLVGGVAALLYVMFK